MRLLPLSLLVYDQPGGVLLYDWSLDAQNVRMTAGERGYESLSWRVEMEIEQAFRVYDGLQVAYVLLTAGFHAWEGRLEDKRVLADGLDLVAFGYWRAIGDFGPYNALWSDSSTARWEEINQENIATVTDTFKSDNNNRIYVAPNKGGTIADGDRGGRYLAIPDQSLRNIVAIMFEYEVAGSSLWKASLRRWASSSFGTPTEVWSPTLTSYATYTGAVCTTLTGSPLLTFEFESEVAQTTLGTVINGVSTTLAPSSPQVNTTWSAGAIANTNSTGTLANTTYGSNISTGSQTITPVSMTGISTGTKLWIKGTGTGEVVAVTATTATTFTATYGLAHTATISIKTAINGSGYVVTPASMTAIATGQKLWIVGAKDTEEVVAVTATTATTFTATYGEKHIAPISIKTAVDGTGVVTPTSMTNIVTGTKLLFNTASIDTEKVTVSAVTSTTFTANFRNTHVITGGEIIRGADDWAVPEVDTATTSGYAAGMRTITPASMANIVAGMTLIIGFGGEAEEEIVVSSVTSTTFNATLIYGHASGEKLKNGPNSYSVRPQSMTGIVTGMNLTIGGRNSEDVTVTATTSTNFTAVFKYGHPGDSPVTTAKRQTVTPASMTHIAKGREYRIGNEAGVANSEPEKVTILETTGSTFTAEFDNPHGSTDTVVRIYSGDYNAWLKVTGLRVATSTTYMINTTIGSKITAGTRTVTPASMANIYVGQKLVVNGSDDGDNGEMVTVTVVTSTTFTAVFSANHTATITVKGIVVYASEIVQDIASSVSLFNIGQLSSSLAGIEATSRDLEIELYEEQMPQDILGYLASEGDDDLYEVGVLENRRLFFRPRGSQARVRVWYTDVVELEMGSTLDTLVNEAYAVYRSANRGLRRTADGESDQSQALYGLIRRSFVSASTTSQTQAEAQRDAYLVDRDVITPRIRIVTAGLFDGADIEFPLWALLPGDELVLRNLPPTLSTSVDRVRRFRVKRTEYDVSNNILVPVPELELAGLDVLIAEPMIKQARDQVKVDWIRANPAVDWVR